MTLKRVTKYFVLLMALISLAACQSNQDEKEIENEVAIQTPASVITPSATIPPTQTPSRTPEPTPLPTPPYAETGKQGYIYIENTKVDYPVMLASDNDYYLNRNSDGSRNYRGAIFFDYRNADPEKRRNIILYGHNNKDQTRFSTLHSFEKESFFLENETIQFEMFGVIYEYEIVYSGIVDYREYNHIRTIFEDEQDFLDYYQEGAQYAQYVREGYEPMPGDQMLTLSTCVSHSIKDYDYKRMIVVARMKEVIGEGDNSDAPEGYGVQEATAVLLAMKNLRYEGQSSEVSATTLSQDGVIDIVIPPGE